MAHGFQRPYLKPEPLGRDDRYGRPAVVPRFGRRRNRPARSHRQPGVINRLFSLPPLSAKEAALVAEALSELAPELPLPAEDASARLRLVDAPLQPVLQLETLHTHGHRAWRGYPQSFGGGPFDVAKVIFRYADADIRPEKRANSLPCPKAKRSAEAPSGG
jgi:hypothetical protein